MILYPHFYYYAENTLRK